MVASGSDEAQELVELARRKVSGIASWWTGYRDEMGVKVGLDGPSCRETSSRIAIGEGKDAGRLSKQIAMRRSQD